MKWSLALAAGGAVVALLFSGCASAPRQPFAAAPVPEGQAAIYFFRPSEMTARLSKPTLSANGSALGKLPNDAYAVAVVPPGDIQVRSVWPGIPGSIRDDSVTVHALAGQRYFLRVRYQTRRPQHLLPKGALQFEDRVGLEEVPESEAAGQLAGMTRAPDLRPAAAAGLK